MHAYSTILFDLDGTLVQSIAAFDTILTEALRKRGAAIDREKFHHWHSERGAWTDLLSHHGLPSEATHGTELERECADAFTEHMRGACWMPGADSLLTSLRSSHRKTGVITSASRRMVDRVDEVLGLYALTDVTITADEVGARIKPDPYGLELAMDALGVSPEDCVFIGDSGADVRAARAAHIHGILIPGEHTPPRAADDADTVLGNLTDILTWLGAR